jgi:hypothetical protein
VKAVGERDYKELSEMCSERLYVRIKECLVGMFADGYRMRLHNKWASNLEYSIFSYMEYEHLSPIVSHNLKLEDYNITQYNFFSFPYKLKCELKLNQKEPSRIVPVETSLSDRFRSPYYIRDLPRDDPYVFELYRKYPLTLLNIDVGFVSHLRYLLTRQTCRR